MVIFCEYEKLDFPESDFVHRNDGSLFEPYIHDVDPVHFAVGSRIVSASSTPSPSPSPTGPTVSSAPSPSPFPPDPTYGGKPTPITLNPRTYNQNIPLVTLRSRLVVQLFLLALDMPIDALQALVRRLSNGRNER